MPQTSTTLTWLDVNSWLLELPGQRVLIDPWLVGDLVFGNAPWLIRGMRPAPVPIPADIDLILLSQGLADHAHPETLRALDKSIPVVASASGAEVANRLGYTTVTPLTPGQTFTLADALQIQALPGAPLGPLVMENAYLMTVLATGLTIYYEPHGYPSADLQPPVDVAITPILSLKLPLLGPVIRGAEGALELAKQVQPQLILPTAEGGDVRYTGLLASVLQKQGGVEALRSQLAAAGLTTRVAAPAPMKPHILDLAPAAHSQEA
jgi:L-ascorbate metabolism protein UlaG (beta-lactamase superfamily)